MTIAISLKVNDGIVLASDSASTIMGRDESGNLVVINIYEKANKIFNLKKGFPIGVISWGSGSIGQASISSLAKDFRTLLDKSDKYKFNPDNYTIEEIAKNFKDFIYNENYVKEFKDWKEKPALGFMIVGYSSNQPMAEEWKIDIRGGVCDGPYNIRKQNQIGITWNGEPEAINRIFLGYSSHLGKVLETAGLESNKIREILKAAKEQLTIPMVTAAMPIQDTTDLASFLVESTINFSKFAPGAATVEGPIEIAAITKHEGFRWVQRKHYFDKKLNYNYSAPAVYSNTINFPTTLIVKRKIIDRSPEVDYSEINENEWHRAMSNNPLTESLYDPAEDIYSLDDGVPFYDEG